MAYARTASVPAAAGAAMTRADGWLRAEEARLRREHPAVERMARVLLSRGVPFVVLATVVAAVVPQYLLGPGGDATAFADAGRVLWSRHALDAFADPYVQTGPLFLAGTGLGARVGDLIGVPPWIPATVLWSTVAALLLLRVTRDLRPGTAAAGRRPATLAALVITLSGPVSVAAAYAHLDDLAVGLLLTLATVHGCRGRARAMGLLLGAAIGVKLWAVLGIPVLLVLVARRQAMRAGTIATALAACCYLPFLLGGAVGTFSYAWGSTTRPP